MRSAENGNSSKFAFCEFVDSTRSKGGGFFGRAFAHPQNDGVDFTILKKTNLKNKKKRNKR